MRKSVTFTAAVILASFVASAVQAEEVGIVIAGRVVQEGTTTPVTFIGSADTAGLTPLSGQLVVGGWFIGGDATGFAGFDPNGKLIALFASAKDADGVVWTLLLLPDGEGYSVDVFDSAGTFSGTGTGPVVNIH